MNCPVCQNEMREQTVEDVTVDVCQGGCGAVWFDQFELQKVDEAHESAGEALLDIECDANVRIDPGQRRKCPRCDDMILMRHYASVLEEIEVDECPQCGGFLLDRGELGKIREQFEDDEGKREATKARFGDLIAKEFDKLEQQSDQQRAKASKFARMFRLLCPSYYIPGKQNWGAF